MFPCWFSACECKYWILEISIWVFDIGNDLPGPDSPWKTAGVLPRMSSFPLLGGTRASLRGFSQSSDLAKCRSFFKRYLRHLGSFWFATFSLHYWTQTHFLVSQRVQRYVHWQLWPLECLPSHHHQSQELQVGKALRNSPTFSWPLQCPVLDPPWAGQGHTTVPMYVWDKK